MAKPIMVFDTVSEEPRSATMEIEGTNWILHLISITTNEDSRELSVILIESMQVDPSAVGRSITAYTKREGGSIMLDEPRRLDKVFGSGADRVRTTVNEAIEHFINTVATVGVFALRPNAQRV